MSLWSETKICGKPNENNKKGKMKECKKLHDFRNENRKARLDKRNASIRDRLATPESSVLNSGRFSNEISLNSLSIRTDRVPSGKFSLSTGILQKCFLDYENRCLSEEDRKILRLMALRREAALEEEEIAFSARNVWARDKQLYTKTMQERKKLWNDYVAQKRRIESIENFRRKQIRAEILNEEKTRLESMINEKHERVERRQKEISTQKRSRPVSNSESQETLHKQIKEQQERERELESVLHLKMYEAKERKTEEKHRHILMEKYRRIKEASLKRDLKWQSAKETREELRRKYEEIQEENMKRYESTQLLSEYRVNWALEWKKKLLLEKNKMKSEHHYYILNKLREEDRQREIQAREEINVKDAKLKYIQDKKEMEVSKSRQKAKIAAELRQKN